MVLPFPFTFWKSASTSAGANPQLLFFENFPNHIGAANLAYSNATLSVHAVNIPLSLSFNYPILLVSRPNSAGSFTAQFGLYSLNGSTLSLTNSASNTIQFSNGQSWISLITSATQNITPGTWYFAFNIISSGTSNFSLYANAQPNLANAVPLFLMGRMTASTNALPSSIATSDLDITGLDALRQPYCILTS